MRIIGRHSAPFLAVPLTLVIAATLFGGSVSAKDTVPFRASFTTAFSSALAFPLIHVTVDGEGQASHMGRTRASTTNQIVNLLAGTGTATYTLTAANGDTVIVDMTVTTEFPSATHVTFAGPYVVIGGTGRFAGATGSGWISGSATFTGPSDGVGAFALDGVISSRGANADEG